MNDYVVDRISAIFIYTLIISGNFLAELYPCKIQYFLRNNITFKHLFGFLTLFFFGIVAIPELSNFQGMITAAFMYIIFIINSKTKWQFWVIVFLLSSFVYILRVFKKDIEKNLLKQEFKPEEEENYKYLNNVIGISQIILVVSIILLTMLGVIIYMGEKKMEYGNKFSYITFFAGKPKCTFESDKLDMYKGFTAFFSK